MLNQVPGNLDEQSKSSINKGKKITSDIVSIDLTKPTPPKDNKLMEIEVIDTNKNPNTAGVKKPIKTDAHNQNSESNTE